MLYYMIWLDCRETMLIIYIHIYYDVVNLQPHSIYYGVVYLQPQSPL